MNAYRLCWRLQSATRLLSDKGLDLAGMGQGGWAFVLRETGQQSAEQLAQVLAQAAQEAVAVIAVQMEAGTWGDA